MFPVAKVESTLSPPPELRSTVVSEPESCWSSSSESDGFFSHHGQKRPFSVRIKFLSSSALFLDLFAFDAAGTIPPKAEPNGKIVGKETKGCPKAGVPVEEKRVHIPVFPVAKVESTLSPSPESSFVLVRGIKSSAAEH